MSSARLTTEPEDEDGEDSSSFMLCKSYFMIWKYYSLDLTKARKVEAWDLRARNLDWGFGSII